MTLGEERGSTKERRKINKISRSAFFPSFSSLALFRESPSESSSVTSFLALPRTQGQVRSTYGCTHTHVHTCTQTHTHLYKHALTRTRTCTHTQTHTLAPPLFFCSLTTIAQYPTIQPPPSAYCSNISKRNCFFLHKNKLSLPHLLNNFKFVDTKIKTCF